MQMLPFPRPLVQSLLLHHITNDVNVDPSTIKDNQRSQSFGASGGHEAPKSQQAVLFLQLSAGGKNTLEIINRLLQAPHRKIS